MQGSWVQCKERDGVSSSKGERVRSDEEGAGRMGGSWKSHLLLSEIPKREKDKNRLLESMKPFRVAVTS